MGKISIRRPKETWRRMVEKERDAFGWKSLAEAAQRAADRGGTEGGRQRRHRRRPTGRKGGLLYMPYATHGAHGILLLQLFNFS